MLTYVLPLFSRQVYKGFLDELHFHNILTVADTLKIFSNLSELCEVGSRLVLASTHLCVRVILCDQLAWCVIERVIVCVGTRGCNGSVCQPTSSAVELGKQQHVACRSLSPVFVYGRWRKFSYPALPCAVRNGILQAVWD